MTWLKLSVKEEREGVKEAGMMSMLSVVPKDSVDGEAHVIDGPLGARGSNEGTKPETGPLRQVDQRRVIIRGRSACQQLGRRGPDRRAPASSSRCDACAAGASTDDSQTGPIDATPATNCLLPCLFLALLHFFPPSLVPR